MNLKAIIQKIASWFKSETSAVETEAAAYISGIEPRAEAIEAVFKADVLRAESIAGQYTISAELAQQFSGSNMSTPAAATAPATTGNNVNTAVQIALALKSIDASLSVEQVQVGTNAALAALYPVAA
ncbi:hypothetical protein [Paraburkholderia sp. BCC1884]|uniref:hypothetical protein n=1 Tax=Paraburkholderia sp. BCC1884 TaxID=2562668 RepID=UPI00118230F7|nr:hypothetical protein [Paraburkholderia sp. BCC1884]